MPPAIGQDGDFSTGQGVEADPMSSAGASNVLDPSQFPMPQTYRDPNQPTVGTFSSYNDGMGTFPQFVHSSPDQQNFYGEMRPSQVTTPHQQYQSQMFAGPQPQSLGTSDSGLVKNDQSTAENLSDVLGELKIDETGIGTISSP